MEFGQINIYSTQHMSYRTRLIAEVKTNSPFGYNSEVSWDELFLVAEKHADIISIHTDPRWGGSFELLEKARGLTGKPILAKGIHESDVDVERAFEFGADYCLVVGRVPNIYEKYKDKIFLEPNTLDELRQIGEGAKVVWNSRDLKAGGLKAETFEEARKIFKGFLVQASNIKTKHDVKPGADAVLVGENLFHYLDSVPTNVL